MKKTIAVLILFIAFIPFEIYAAEQDPASYTIQSEDTVTQADDESPVNPINPSEEQIALPEEQTLSPEMPEEDTVEEVQSLENKEEGTRNDNRPVFDVPVTLNEKVESYIHYFTNRIREKFSTWLARSERYLPMMKKTFKDKGLPEDLSYLALIESGFNNKAYSTAKAVGQWQFIHGTGKRYGLRIDRWIDERRDPEKATKAAADYLGDLYGMFNDWYLAAAGYNAGEGKISRAIDKYDTNDFWQLAQPKYRYLKGETKDYVPKFIAAALIAKEPAKYGFDIDYHTSLVYETVAVNGMKDLREIAAVGECDIEELKTLNPELKTNFTPPNYPDYQLKVPVGKSALIENRMAYISTIPERVALKEVGPEKVGKKRYAYKRGSRSKKVISYYIVKKGDTLHKIAAKHNVRAKHLAKWNKLRTKQLKVGKKLKIYAERGAYKKLS